MNRSLFFLIILVVSFSTLLINYTVFKSLVGQNIIMADKSSMNLSYSTVDSLLPSIPNINVTAMPLAAYRVNYLLNEGRLDEVDDYILESANVNPHVFIGDLLKAKLYYYRSNYDSAFIHAKKAFFGWPKNLIHYNTYLDVLEKQSDTLSLVEAFNFLDPSLKANPEYFYRFYESLNKIKLSFLITTYPDQRSVLSSELIGKWERVYNFPHQVVRDSTLFYDFISNTQFKSPSGDIYNFVVAKDTFKVFFTNNNMKPIVTNPIMFSDSLQTLIFRNVKTFENTTQDQFFRKAQ